MKSLSQKYFNVPKYYLSDLFFLYLVSLLVAYQYSLYLFSIHVLKLQAKEFGVRSKPAAAAFYKIAQLGLST